MFTERGSEMGLHTIIGSWEKQGTIDPRDVTPLDVLEDFGIKLDPEPILPGFYIREPKESFYHKKKALERIARRAGLTCVQKEILFQHILCGVPLGEVRLTTCGDGMYSMGCLQLALSVAKDAIKASKEN